MSDTAQPSFKDKMMKILASSQVHVLYVQLWVLVIRLLPFLLLDQCFWS